MNRKEKKVLSLFELLECGLSLIALMIFTYIFRLESTNIRYLFLLGDVYVIYSFTKTVSSLQSKIQKRVLTEKK